jgi:hypothetical protein
MPPRARELLLLAADDSAVFSIYLSYTASLMEGASAVGTFCINLQGSTTATIHFVQSP